MAICDVCDAEVEWSNGYVLTATEVLTSEEYWIRQFTLRRWWARRNRRDPRGHKLVQGFDRIVADQSPWLVCEECSGLFRFDRTLARRCAIEKIYPPDRGTLGLTSVGLAAGYAWLRCYGIWPASVTVDGERTGKCCSFCGRALRSPETLSLIKDWSSMVELGVLLPPRGATPTATQVGVVEVYIACPNCLARASDRSHWSKEELSRSQQYRLVRAPDQTLARWLSAFLASVRGVPKYVARRINRDRKGDKARTGRDPAAG